MNVQVDEPTLNEIYLPPDENAVKLGHTAAIMGALNKVNGEADLPTLGRSSPACYLDQARNRDSFNHPSQARRLPTSKPTRHCAALARLGAHQPDRGRCLAARRWRSETPPPAFAP